MNTSISELISEFDALCKDSLQLSVEQKNVVFFSKEYMALQDVIREKNNLVKSKIIEISDSITEEDGKAIISAIGVSNILIEIAMENFFSKSSPNYAILRKLQFFAIENIKDDYSLKCIEAIGYDLEIRRHTIKQYKGRGYLIELLAATANATIQNDISQKIRSLPKSSNCNICSKPLQIFTASDLNNNPKKTSYLCPDCRIAICADCSYQAAQKKGINNWICPKCDRPIANYPARIDKFE